MTDISKGDTGAPTSGPNPVMVATDPLKQVQLTSNPTIEIGQVAIDGDDGNGLVGAKTDSVWDGVAAGASWTALFKYIATKIEAVRAAIVTLTSAATPAGSNLIGKIGIDQTTPGTTDHVTASGYSSVKRISMTRPADTAAYIAGDLFGANTAVNISNVMIFSPARGPDYTSVLSRVHAKINDANFAGKRIRLHFHRDLPTLTVGDNGAFNNGGAATESSKIGTVDLTFGLYASSDGFVKAYAGMPDAASWVLEPSSSTTNIFVLVEVLDALTPASGKILTVALELIGQN